MEWACPANDVLLDLLHVETRLGFNEERGRWPSITDDDALFDQVSASYTDIILDGFGIAS